MFKKISMIMVMLVTIIFNSGIANAVEDNSTDMSAINWIEGPKTVDVGKDLATLDLPSGYVFANGEDAKKLMKEMDNSITGIEQGIVFPDDENENWYVLFEFDDIGYVEDTDANKIDADNILSEIKEGTEEDNKERKKNGKPTLDIIGWDEKPHYDSKTHNLSWSVLSTSEGEQIINYNVRILGRGGVTEVTLVADKDEIEKLKPNLETIISKYSYKEGKKYSDYIKGDKLSTIGGIAALIAGGAGAAKIGLLSTILLILKKIGIFIIVGIGGIFKLIMGRFKKKRAETNNNVYSQKNDMQSNFQDNSINEISSSNMNSSDEEK